MTLTTIPSLLAILFCAALFILLYQNLFPRQAPWKLVAAALGAGMVVTLLLVAAMAYLADGGKEAITSVSTLAEALPVAVFRAGLPEEAIKALAALAAVFLFRRNLTSAAAFQIPLFVAVGFAIVENNGYSETFPEYRMIIAFGRGFMATFVHSLLAMVQGVFLMRIVAHRAAAPDALLVPGGPAEAPSGVVVWGRWYFAVLGLLASATCHSLYDWGFLPVLGEFLRTGTVQPETAVLPMLVGICGIILLFVAGLWSLRIATRRAAAADPISHDPAHLALVATWRKCGTALMLLGAVGFAGGIAWLILAGEPAAVAAESPDLGRTLIILCALLGALLSIIIGWVVRQKR